MKTLYLLIAITGLSLSLQAQDKPAAAKGAQFLLIIRSKAGSQPTQEQIQTNGKHWGQFMGDLAKNGTLAVGYRPTTTGETISGTSKTQKSGSYVANDEQVSSVLVINATDMKQAREIAAKCPVFELQGSVEIRPMQNVAN